MHLFTKNNSYFLFLLISVMCSIKGSAQSSDFLLLKKSSKTIRHYIAGQHIEFTSNTGAYHDALITGIKNDSIYLQEFLVQRLLTTYGGFIKDTVGSFRYIYYYKDILYFGKNENKSFNVSGSGGALLGGGTLLTLASGVVWLVDRDSFSPELMTASAGLAGLGFLMSGGRSKPITVGKKKYRLEYINMQTGK